MLRRALRKIVRSSVIVEPRIFGVGAEKTGTHSLASMFSDYVATAHEPDSEILIKLLLDRKEGGSNAAILRFLAKQDSARRLKINSSHINVFLVQELRELFPGSHYVLTMRHPLEWLRSKLDDSLRRDTSEHWHRFRDFRFGAKDKLPGPEQPLAEAGLYSLGGYLAYWKTAITLPIEQIGSERLLIVRTQDLHSRAQEIAEFCDIERFKPDPRKGSCLRQH